MLLCFAVPCVRSAEGIIIQVTDGVMEVAPPASVVFNDTESSNIIVFAEQQDLTLSADLEIDASTPGLFDGSVAPVPATIPAGTILNSYFVHFDPIGTTQTEQFGAIVFDEPILGLIITPDNLSTSDAVLGLSGTSYPTGQAARGLENVQDIFELSADRRTVTIHRFSSTFPGEQMRIITVPEPAARWLAVAAVLPLLGWYLRRRRNYASSSKAA